MKMNKVNKQAGKCVKRVGLSTNRDAGKRKEKLSLIFFEALISSYLPGLFINNSFNY